MKKEKTVVERLEEANSKSGIVFGNPDFPIYHAIVMQSARREKEDAHEEMEPLNIQD